MIPLLLAATVTISGFAFKPAALTILTGQSVRFVNRDQEAHTVTATGNAFDSAGLDTGASWSHIFTRPGTYTYYCELHPYMKGTIVVLPAGAHKT